MNKKIYRIGEVSKQVGRTAQTINLWYQAERRGYDLRFKLPEPEYINNQRYFSQEDIDQLIYIKENMKRGDMAKYNRQHKWGKLGKEIQKRIDEKKTNI